jgi:hypothetical protein
MTHITSEADLSYLTKINYAALFHLSKSFYLWDAIRNPDGYVQQSRGFTAGAGYDSRRKQSFCSFIVARRAG